MNFGMVLRIHCEHKSRAETRHAPAVSEKLTVGVFYCRKIIVPTDINSYCYEKCKNICYYVGAVNFTSSTQKDVPQRSIRNGDHTHAI